MNEQDERGAFEQYLRDKKFPVLPVWQNGKPHQNYALEVMWDAWQARAASTSANVAQGSKLSVWYGSLPESNGKANWTAILHKGNIAEGITIERSEYPDRVRYEADRMRWMIGELDKKPFILNYDADKHSGYVADVAQRAEAVGWFVRRSKFGPWVEVEQQEPGAEQFYRGAPPAQPALPDDARDAFIRNVAAQKPEKPDHWSSCGQCEHNIERAQDLLDAAQSASGDTK